MTISRSAHLTTTIISGCYWPSSSGTQHQGRMHSFTAVCFYSCSPWQVPGLSASPKCQWELQLLPEFSRLEYLWQLDSDKLYSNIVSELYLFALLPLNPKAHDQMTLNIRSSQDWQFCRQSPSYLKNRAITCMHTQAPTQQLQKLLPSRQVSQTCKRYTYSRSQLLKSINPEDMGCCAPTLEFSVLY